MLEPVVVDAPIHFPNACVQCHGQTGPLVDTHVEDRFGNRVYVCASCVRLDAIALGLIRGKRHSELLAAMKATSEDQRFAEAANEQAAHDRAALEAERRTSQQLVEERDMLQQRIVQLEDALRAEAKAALAVAGAGAA